MAQFLGDIAGILEIITVAAGLMILHRGRTDGAGLVKLAGVVLIVGGLGSGLCTGYYWVKYQQSGAFETAYPQHGMDMDKMMKHMHQMMGDGGMMGMMHGKGKAGGMGHGQMGMKNKAMACPEGDACPGMEKGSMGDQPKSGMPASEGHDQNDEHGSHDHGQ